MFHVSSPGCSFDVDSRQENKHIKDQRHKFATETVKQLSKRNWQNVNNEMLPKSLVKTSGMNTST